LSALTSRPDEGPSTPIVTHRENLSRSGAEFSGHLVSWIPDLAATYLHAYLRNTKYINFGWGLLGIRICFALPAAVGEFSLFASFFLYE